MGTEHLRFPDLLHEDYQRLVLALLLRSEPFCARARSVLQPGYFSSAAYEAICMAVFAFWDAYRTLPPAESLRVALSKSTAIELRPVYDRVLNDLLAVSEDELHEDHVQAELVWFAQRAEAAVAVGTAFRSLTQFDIDLLSADLRRIGQLPGLFTDLGLSVRESWPQVLTIDDRSVFHTGWDGFDAAMRGGIREGELTSLLAPMKRGKSQVLINIGARLLLMGHRVVHYSMEMYAPDVLARYCSVLSGIPTNTLGGNPTLLAAVMERLHEFVPATADITIKEYPARGVTVDILEGHLRTLEDRYSTPIVPVVDYGDLIKGPNVEEWKELQEVYVELRNLGRRHHVPVFTASQTNAPGFKGELNAQHQSGSTRKAFVVDWFWALNQTDEDYACNRFRLSPMLARFARKNVQTYWVSDYATGRIQEISLDAYTSLAAPTA